MSKLMPKYVTCPACGRRFTNRGYRNHVNKCKTMSPMERETTKRIREMNK
jgi:uncharacterized C2H2 Zn-finger protein